MLGKVITGFVVVAISSGLIYGAVNRTMQRDVSVVDQLIESPERYNEGELYGDGNRNGQIELNEEGLDQDDPGEFNGGSRLANDEIPGPGYCAGSDNAPGYKGSDGAGTGLAVDASSWIEVTGTVTALETDLLQVKMTDGSLIELSRRAWWFALDQGFTAETGDQIKLTGFYEGDEFETAILNNLTKNIIVTIRDDNGRPLWAGRGR